MIKVVHIGDLHLGGLYPEKSIASMEFLLAQLEDSTSPAYHPDLIVCTGDTTEKSLHVKDPNLSPLTDLIQAPFPKVFLQGTPSHEPYGFLENLWKTSGQSFILMNKPEIIQVPGTQISIAALPAISWATLNKWAMDRFGQTAETPEENVRSILASFANEWNNPQTGPRLLIGHWTVTGCMTPTGQTLYASDMAIGLADVALAQADAVLLGHIHKVQHWNVGDDNAPISYCGSSHNANWGELDAKSFSVFEFPETGGIPELTRILYPSKPMLEIKILYTGEQVDGDWEFNLVGDIELPEFIELARGADVKLKYERPKELAPQVDDIYQRIKFHELGIELTVVEGTLLPTDRNRIPDIGEVTTTRAQYLAVCTAKGKVPRPGSLLKADQIDESGVAA